MFTFAVDFLRMLKFSSVLGLVVLFSVAVYGQQQAVSHSRIPFSDSHNETISDFSKVFQYVAPVATNQYSWKNWSTVENFTFGKDRGSMHMVSDLSSLHPYFRDKIVSLIAACKAKGIELAVVEAYRSHSKQNEYRSMGKKYTRSSGGNSKHQYGLAVDVVPIVDSIPQWEDAKLWKKVGTAGEQLGLRWGGRWRTPYDPGHFEWTGGLSSYHLSGGIFPKVPMPELYPCLEEELAVLTESWKAWEVEQSTLSRKATSSSSMR